MKQRSNQEKEKRKDMSTSEGLSYLQEGLYRKVKQERDYRFYILYDKLQLNNVLEESWHRIRAKGGTSEVDGVKISDL